MRKEETKNGCVCMCVCVCVFVVILSLTKITKLN